MNVITDIKQPQNIMYQIVKADDALSLAKYYVRYILREDYVHLKRTILYLQIMRTYHVSNDRHCDEKIL